MDRYFPPPDQEGGWRTRDPLEVGMNAQKLDETFELIQGGIFRTLRTAGICKRDGTGLSKCNVLDGNAG